MGINRGGDSGALLLFGAFSHYPVHRLDLCSPANHLRVSQDLEPLLAHNQHPAAAATAEQSWHSVHLGQNEFLPAEVIYVLGCRYPNHFLPLWLHMINTTCLNSLRGVSHKLSWEPSECWQRECQRYRCLFAVSISWISPKLGVWQVCVIFETAAPTVQPSACNKRS